MPKVKRRTQRKLPYSKEDYIEATESLVTNEISILRKNLTGEKLKDEEIKNNVPGSQLGGSSYSSDDSDVVVEGFNDLPLKLSEYEKKRLENIKHNYEMLEALDLIKAKKSFEPVTNPKRTPQSKAGLRLRTRKSFGQPRRISMRLKNMPVDNTPTPVYREPTYNEYFNRARKTGTISMEAINAIGNDEASSAISSWSKLKCTTYKEEQLKNFEKFEGETANLVVKQCIKVTKDRVFSMTMHPSEEKTVVCVGDKSGHVGIWDVGCREGQDSEVLLFSPHTRPINCLKFCPMDASKLFSCSYDGSIRCADLHTQKFTEISVFEEDTVRFNYFAWPANKLSTILAATSDGNMQVVDTRTRKFEQTFELFEKSTRCVDCHPVNENVFVSNSYNGVVATWDLRCMKRTSNKWLSFFRASKTTSTCFYSPRTGSKLLFTAQDDLLRIFQTKSDGSFLETPPEWSIRHNNFVGRWLTTFRACWDPKSDSCFVCGSMERPRQLDAYGCLEDGKISHLALRSELLSTVPSVNAFHPSANVIASGNASGKVYLWS